MQITSTSTSYSVKGVRQSTVKQPVNNLQQVERIAIAKNDQQDKQQQKIENFSLSEKSYAEFEKANNALQQNKSQFSQANENFSRYEKPSHYQQQAIDAYQLVGDYQQRETVQQMLGVDLYT